MISQTKIFLYGPPGSGKSSLAEVLANELDLPFMDLDEMIEDQAGEDIAKIFSNYGERGFRERESKLLREVIDGFSSVVSLGGGALLDTANRSLVESAGKIVCLRASLDTIQKRVEFDETVRPLLPGSNSEGLVELLSERESHYESFPLSIDTDNRSIEDLAWEIQVLLGMYRVRGMNPEYDVRFFPEALEKIGEEFERLDLAGPVAIISDENVAPLYMQDVLDALKSSGYVVESYIIPAGEKYKNISTINRLWEVYSQARLERKSTIVALGGGVVGDLIGFSAATFLRGVHWVCIPTSTLAMVDASLGGKTAADLPQGKNLIGAFYPPRSVFVDPSVLSTLPAEEMTSGMAEVVKHGIIGDPGLFELCRAGWRNLDSEMDEVIRRAMAVKINIIQEDPFEGGVRATLNLGHTLGHAIERASNYTIRHGEAVSVGIVAAARLSAELGFAEEGLVGDIEEVLSVQGLPTRIPVDISREDLLQAMTLDKKRSSGVVRLVLPVAVGNVRYGFSVDEIESLIDTVWT